MRACVRVAQAPRMCAEGVQKGSRLSQYRRVIDRYRQPGIKACINKRPLPVHAEAMLTHENTREACKEVIDAG